MKDFNAVANTIKEKIREADRVRAIDFWFDNQTFNELLFEADSIQISDKGVLEMIFYDRGLLGVTMREGVYDAETGNRYYAKVEHFEEWGPNIYRYTANTSYYKGCEIL